MRMNEGENIAQYAARIKEVVNSIRSVGGEISEEMVIRKNFTFYLWY